LKNEKSPQLKVQSINYGQDLQNFTFLQSLTKLPYYFEGENDKVDRKLSLEVSEKTLIHLELGGGDKPSKYLYQDAPCLPFWQYRVLREHHIKIFA
jgi:hypothetical protein